MKRFQTWKWFGKVIQWKKRQHAKQNEGGKGIGDVTRYARGPAGNAVTNRRHGTFDGSLFRFVDWQFLHHFLAFTQYGLKEVLQPQSQMIDQRATFQLDYGTVVVYISFRLT